MVNCMLLSSCAPKSFWREALFSACLILNRVPQRNCDVTLYEHWKEGTPNIQLFKVWDLLAKVLIPKPKKRKNNPKTVDAIFNGYILDSKVNRFLVVNFEISEISNNTIIEAKDDVYFENMVSFKSRILNDPSITSFIYNIHSSSSAPATDSETRRRKRTRTLTSFSEVFFTYFVKDDPTSFKEVMNSSKSLF